MYILYTKSSQCSWHDEELIVVEVKRCNFEPYKFQRMKSPRLYQKDKVSLVEYLKTVMQQLTDKLTEYLQFAGLKPEIQIQ